MRRHRGNGSLVAAGTAVVAVTYGLVRFGYGLHLLTFTAEFGLSPAVAGAVGAGSFAGYCVTALLAQRLIAARRPRRALWTAGVLAAGGSAVTAVAWSAPSLAVGVLVGGSAAGAASPALVTAVAATVPVATADRAQAVVNSGTGLGVVAGGLLAAALADRWRLLWAGFALVAVAATWWADRSTDWGRAGPEGPPTGAHPHPRSPDLALIRPSLVAALLAGAGSAAVWTFGRDLLVAAGTPATTSALLWAALGGAGALGAFSGDLVRRLGPAAAWTATATVMAVATVGLVAAPGRLLPAATALVAFGAGYVTLSGVLISWATTVTRAERPSQPPPCSSR